MNWLASRWGRLTAFFFLYVTEGIPLGFSATTLATAMRREGVSPEEIGWFLSALYAPWGFKWIFGPVVDLIGRTAKETESKGGNPTLDYSNHFSRF